MTCRFLKYRFVVLSAMLLASQSLWASLTPYESHYVLMQDDDRVGSASRVLTKTENNQWRMETKSKAKLFFVRIIMNQTTDFEFNDGIITPLNFSQLSDTGISSERRMTQHFDWDAGKDIGKYKGKPWSRDLNKGSYSRVTDVIQFQEQLKAANEPIPEASFEINYRGNAKTESYIFEAREDVTTPSGTYSSLKYKKLHSNPDRVSYFWFVPELNYIPVRIQQLHTGKEQANMLLKTIQFN